MSTAIDLQKRINKAIPSKLCVAYVKEGEDNPFVQFHFLNPKSLVSRDIKSFNLSNDAMSAIIVSAVKEAVDSHKNNTDIISH